MRQVDRTLNSQERFIAIYHAYKKVGTCVLHIEDRQRVNRTQNSLFPNSWFLNKKSETAFPFLKITGLETMEQKEKGNGRLCLQALFEYSKLYGCKGRMVVQAAFASAPFYEHCGFEGGEIGQDGIKYFDPTDKNISLLYKDGMPEGNFKLIPMSIPDSPTDNDLLNQMITKAKNMKQRS